MWFGIVLLVLGTVSLGVAGLYLYIWVLFTRFPAAVGTTLAKLQHTKHKRDVRIYDRPPGGTWRQVAFVKHMTKARYVYTVAGKDYSIRDDYMGTPRQTPLFISVKYWKRFPRFACVYTDVSVKEFALAASCMCWAIPAAAMLLCGVVMLTL